MSVGPMGQTFEPVLAARERVQVGPVPHWVVTSAFDPKGPVQPGDHWTQLLLSRQTHVESQRTHFHSAIRLETMQGVQHISQWRVQFEPQTESVVVHWARIRRGEEQIDYTQPDRFRILQREEGLDSFVVDGTFTLLLVLEDVRVGDILETCCTIESRPRLMPEAASAFFALPAGVSVGKFRFSIRCRESRPMRWKSSVADVKPVETRENGETVWVWEGDRHVAPKLESNVPDWYSENRWIQFSDLSDWQAVSAAVHQAWPHQHEDSILDELVKEICRDEPNLRVRVEKVIRFVQDEYRYLSINSEVGGRIPAAPSRVARRRFGDCKDLAFLLVHLLKRAGVPARPVLVHASLRRTVRDMLPTPDLFNHALVEFELEGKRRWVDAVAKLQGGGALNCVIAPYGVGLAVDAGNGGLIEPPPISRQASHYEIRETLLLDTTGAPSILAVLVTASGSHAESLRHQFANLRREDIEKERLQRCANRFTRAERAGLMQVRDDRDANQFWIAEVFEVNGFLLSHPEAGICLFPFPLNLAFNILLMPEKGVRRSPFALYYPCDFTHTIEVESSALQPVPFKRCNLEDKYLRFSRSHKHVYRHWAVTFAFSTLADAVPAHKIEEHRKMLAEIENQSLFRLHVPLGYAHPRRRDDFGALPLAPLPRPRKANAETIPPPARSDPPARRSAPEEVRPDIPVRPPARPRPAPVTESHPSEQRSHRSKRGVQPRPAFTKAFVAVVVVIIAALIPAVMNRFRHVGIDPAVSSARGPGSFPILPGGSNGDDWQANVVVAARLLGGGDVPRDVAAATNRLWRAVEAGHAPSMTLLGELLMRGELIPKDFSAAMHWLKRAADLGHAPAQALLADTAFATPPGQPMSEAVRYYEMAAAQNWPRALAALGILYGEGKHVPANDKLSRDFLTRAAAMDEPRAQFSLGLAFLNGRFGDTNITEAARLLRSSAEQGFPPGQNAYGYQLSRGQGVEQDGVEAWKWYELAARERDPNALINMQSLRGRLNAAQIEEAKSRAATFRPRPLGTPAFLVPAGNPSPGR